MTQARLAALLVAATLLTALTGTSACQVAQDDAAARKAGEQDVLAQRALRMTDALARTDVGAPNPTPIARWLLPPGLREVSGLALTTDGRLLAHNDSHGRVFEIDYRRGTMVKDFRLGPPDVQADFEGITVADEAVVLLTSDGVLYTFAEGKDGAHVPYTADDTGLGGDCEFEGVAFDSSITSLLLACKIVKAPALRDSLVVFRWKLQDGLARAARLSRLTVPVARVVGANGWKTFHPSDITVDQKSGNYLIVAARDKALLEITPAGAVVSARPLPGDHPQAEGLAVTKDRILIVSDEAKAGPAAITLYRLP